MNRSNSWKYNHETTPYRSRKLQIWSGSLLFCSILLFIVTPLTPVPFFFMLAAMTVYALSKKRQITIGSRYLICGDTIVYFGNVSHVLLEEDKGKLSLKNMNGPVFVLEREKFPTNARKTDKIKKNMDAKFIKVSERIINRITSISPTIEISRNPGSFPLT